MTQAPQARPNPPNNGELYKGPTSPHAYGEFPQLEGLTEDDLRAAILRARLGPDDAQIAIGRLIWRMCWVDIADAVHMDRTTAMRRMKNIIIPRLSSFIQQKAGA